jgi:hypothetical protein
MSAFSAAASDEDCDEIARQRELLMQLLAENAKLREQRDELLEAAKLCRPYIYDYASNTFDGAFDKLCAAIAKATGERK